ncbi:MAG: DUF1800 domain-containing protein [Actinomycetota bacterium]
MNLTADEIEHREAIAHLLRRTTFGPAAGRVDRLAVHTYDDIVDRLLADTADRAVAERGGGSALDLPMPIGLRARLEAERTGEDVEVRTDDDGEPVLEDEDVLQWWLHRLRHPDAGLHERMVWYWHGHFTAHLHSGESEMVWNHHVTMRRHALGNFRELTRAMLRDPLMLLYLDGAGSNGESPNENLARELMELFTLGVGNFTEDDVKAGARALSGWHVDWESHTAWFDPETHYDRPVSFLGTRGRFGTDEIADAVCDHPACPVHVATRLHRHLVGHDPEPAEAERLGRIFRAADLEILPLVAAIVRSDGFAAGRRTRPRQPVEWLIGALSALGADHAPIDTWQLHLAGQVPLSPPNVAGWPDDDRWLGASQILTRVNQVLGRSWDESLDTSIDPTVDAVLARCSIWEVSPETRSTLEQAIARQGEFDSGLELLFALSLCSPEFALA